jgi:Tol biopolymer transport system component
MEAPPNPARRLGVVLATGAATALALGVALAAPAADGASQPRELALVRGDGTAAEIYVIRSDGKGLRRLTRNRVSDFSPAWSRDGQRILFASNRDGDDELYTMDANGKDVRQLTRNRSSDLTPRWSPDGRWIAFASDRARRGEPEIWLMRADGSSARRLVRTPNHSWQDFQFSPTWSQDGGRLIFTMAVSDGNPELHRAAVDGTGLKRLTFTGGNSEQLGDDTMPDWAFGRVVFTSNRGGASSDLWTMRPDGSGQHAIARRSESDEWHPRLSPSGREVAFTQIAIATDRRSIWISRADGKNARVVTEGSEPDWRPKP